MTGAVLLAAGSQRVHAAACARRVEGPFPAEQQGCLGKDLSQVTLISGRPTGRPSEGANPIQTAKGGEPLLNGRMNADPVTDRGNAKAT